MVTSRNPSGVYDVEVDVRDMTGSVVVVTGADSGLGFECTKTFLRKGAHVVFACASAERARTAIADLSDDPTIDSVETSVSWFVLGLSYICCVRVNLVLVLHKHITRT
jgi:NAD(P)-dependent dehydrogenase (short-subunit alcohol dehydrogenase family)